MEFRDNYEEQKFTQKQSSPIPILTKNNSSSFIKFKEKAQTSMTPREQQKLVSSQPESQNKSRNTQEDPDISFENECFVCKKQFSFFVNRHHCRFCGHSICKEHGAKTRAKRVENKIEQLRICDICDQTFVQNNMNQNLSGDNEILIKKVSKLKLRIQQKQKEIIDANFKIKDLQNTLNNKENDCLSREQKIRKLLQEEQMKHEHTRNVTESLRVALEQSQKGEKITEDLNKRYKFELEQQKNSNEILNLELQQLKVDFDKIVTENKYLKKTLNQKEDIIEDISTNRASSIGTDKEENNQQITQVSGNFRKLQSNNPQKASFKDSVLQQKANEGTKPSSMKIQNQSNCKCLVM